MRPFILKLNLCYSKVFQKDPVVPVTHFWSGAYAVVLHRPFDTVERSDWMCCWEVSGTTATVDRVTLEVGSLVCNCGLVYTRHAHHSGLLQPNAMERTLFLFEHSEVVFSSGQTETETFGRNHEDTCLPFDWVLYVLIRHIANTLCFSLRGQTIALNVGC